MMETALPLVGLGSHDQAMQRLDAPAARGEFRGQPVEQLGKHGRLSLTAEIIRRGHDASPEVPLPDAVHHHPRSERMIRLGKPHGKLFARERDATAGAIVGSDIASAQERRQARAHLFSAAIEFAAEIHVGVRYQLGFPMDQDSGRRDIHQSVPGDLLGVAIGHGEHGFGDFLAQLLRLLRLLLRDFLIDLDGGDLGRDLGRKCLLLRSPLFFLGFISRDFFRRKPLLTLVHEALADRAFVKPVSRFGFANRDDAGIVLAVVAN